MRTSYYLLLILWSIVVSNEGCQKETLDDVIYYDNIGNNPKRIIFVNGFHVDNPIASIVVSHEEKQAYWAPNIIEDVKTIFQSSGASLTQSIFIDGAGENAFSKGYERYAAGYEYLIENIDFITQGLLPNETINFYTHSHGSAYGAGMAQALIDQGYNVECVIHTATSGPTNFSTPTQPYTIQFGYKGDHVVEEEHPVPGVDRFALIIRNDLPLLKRHIGPRIEENTRIISEIKTLNNLSIHKSAPKDQLISIFDQTVVFDKVIIDGYYAKL